MTSTAVTTTVSSMATAGSAMTFDIYGIAMIPW
jgi:hypothetical protein